METRLTVELVPSTCRYTNVRSHVPKAVWDRLRRQVAAEAGDRCEICGGQGRRWPVECHEVPPVSIGVVAGAGEPPVSDRRIGRVTRSRWRRRSR